MFEPKLTEAERLVIWRRRLGFSQQKMSKRLAVGMRRLISWELGRTVPAISMPVPSLLSELLVHERCRVLRIRAGHSREQFAKMIRCSPWWVTRMEAGEAPTDKLERYWNE